MVDTPSGARLLSDTEIGDTWVDTKQIWIRSGFLLFLIGIGFIVLHFSEVVSVKQILLLMMIITIIIMKINWDKIVQMKGELDVISISSGHPWHDSEGADETTVYVLSEGPQWVALEPNARLVSTSDPLLNRSLLRDGDSDGDVLVRWEGDTDPKIIAIINMAQALANAQDRGEDDTDSFEDARDREATAEGLLEREWMETDEGAVDYEPGAILRAFKRSKDDDDAAGAFEFKESSDVDSE